MGTRPEPRPSWGSDNASPGTIDRNWIKDGWRSAITDLLKAVALADTGHVVADHLWLCYCPWTSTSCPTAMQLGARITCYAVVTRYVKGYN